MTTNRKTAFLALSVSILARILKATCRNAAGGEPLQSVILFMAFYMNEKSEILRSSVQRMNGTAHFSFLKEARKYLVEETVRELTSDLRRGGPNGSLTRGNYPNKLSESRTTFLRTKSFLLFMYCLAMNTLRLACELLTMWRAVIMDRISNWARIKSSYDYVRKIFKLYTTSFKKDSL